MVLNFTLKSFSMEILFQSTAGKQHRFERTANYWKISPDVQAIALHLSKDCGLYFRAY